MRDMVSLIFTVFNKYLVIKTISGLHDVDGLRPDFIKTIKLLDENLAGVSCICGCLSV